MPGATPLSSAASGTQGIPNVVVSPPAAVFKDPLKMKTPPIYKGSRKADAAETWALEMKAYFQSYKTLTNRLLSDEAKITVTAGYLEGTAKVWWLRKEERL